MPETAPPFLAATDDAAIEDTGSFEGSVWVENFGDMGTAGMGDVDVLYGAMPEVTPLLFMGYRFSVPRGGRACGGGGAVAVTRVCCCSG